MDSQNAMPLTLPTNIQDYSSWKFSFSDKETSRSYRTVPSKT